MTDLSILYVMNLWLENSSQQFINNCRHFSDGENKALSSANHRLLIVFPFKQYPDFI